MTVAKKNTAYYHSFPAVDSDSPASFKSGLTITDTAYYKDGAGAWTALAITDTYAEIGSTGVYEISLTAAELNHDQILIKLTATGMADDFASFDFRTKLTDDLNDLATTDTIANVTTTANLTANNDKTGYALSAASVSEILTTQMTEAYAADGTAPTLAQALFLIQQALTEFAINTTSVTVKKLDGATTAAVMTLDDAASPTSSTRSS